jgi:hypothetical protein
MLDKNMLHSRFGNNVNKYALAIWESSFVSLEDKYEVLCKIDMPEFKDTAHGIVCAFNFRTGSSYVTMDQIHKSLVISSDLVMMELSFPGLVKAVKYQDAKQGIMDSVLHCSSTHSKLEILRMTVNLLVGFKNGSIPMTEQKEWAHDHPDKLLELSQRNPTMEELRSLELTEAEIQQYLTQLQYEESIDSHDGIHSEINHVNL